MPLARPPIRLASASWRIAAAASLGVEQAEAGRAGPDMRASRQLGRDHAQDLGWPADRDRGRLEIVDARREPPQQGVVARYGGGSGLRGRARPLQAERRTPASLAWRHRVDDDDAGAWFTGADRMSPMPRIMRGRGSRQTGMSAPVARAASMMRLSPMAS
jgi:hypothetical protein